jgi:hypothetical protein
VSGVAGEGVDSVLKSLLPFIAEARAARDERAVADGDGDRAETQGWRP